MQANHQRGEVALEIEGVRYVLVLNTAAMMAAEAYVSEADKRPITWDQFWERILRGSVRSVVILLWAMMRKYHAEIGPDRVAELVDAAGGLPGITAALEAAARSQTPDPADAKALGIAGQGAGAGRPTRRAKTAK